MIGSSSSTTVNWFGQRQSLHATSSGKVFLANMPHDQLRTYLDAEMTRDTPHTVVDAGELETELAVVREQGYAQTIEEQEIGLVAVAAPIRALDDRFIGALSVSGPTFRI